MEVVIKQVSLTFTHKKVVNTYIVHEMNLWSNIQRAKFAKGNSLLGAIMLTENVYHNKYEYSGYGIGFDVRGSSFVCYQMVGGLVKM